MQIPLVMTVIGKDRPGLVELVARLVAEHGGNWLESRMCRLGGEFAGILRIHIDKAQETPLIHALAALSAQGITIVARPDTTDLTVPQERLASLEIVGQDRPGIVRQITHALARQGVNVEEFQSECRSAPMSGEPLFAAHIKLHIPASCNLGDLRLDLEQIASDLMVDATLAAWPPK